VIGSTISHYKVLEKLGEGGMGVVYKAQDLELDRFVAIKALPERLVEHDTEQQRFIQEAKAASALNHPHVCTIYDFLKVEGKQYIVMEYVDGRTLRDVLRSGVPDQATAISYAVQIGEALEEAHAHSIVHRDIKPENLMVNSKNQIKVMDFGLAKLKGALKLTRTSSTVGTLSYMAPEQIEGKEVDARSDIFSFGIVLYEMLSGHIPFRGEHEASLMYSILNEEPAPIEQYRPDVPQDLRHILDRALEKDPEERYQSLHEMLIELRRLKKVSTRVVRPSEGSSASTREGRMPARRFRMPLIAVSAVLLAVAVYLVLLKKGVEINPNFRQHLLQLPFKTVSLPALSPDGKWVVFGARDAQKKFDLYVVGIEGGESRRLTFDNDTVMTESPEISPDGNTIVYCRGDASELCLVPFIGGTSKKVGVGTMPQWSPDGKRIGYTLLPPDYVPRSRSGYCEFWTMNADGSANQLEFTDTLGARNLAVFYFAFSPDSRSVAWLRKLPARYCEIVVHDLASHKERRVVADTTWKGDLCWGSNDQIIYSSRGVDGVNLWKVDASGGVPEQVTKGTNRLDIGAISSDARRVAFLQSVNTQHIRIARLDGSAKETEVASEEADIWYPEISPDGKSVTFSMQPTASSELHLYVVDRDGSNRRQMTQGRTANWNGRWSPDGRYIAFNSKQAYESFDSAKVFVMRTDKFDIPRMVHPGTINNWTDAGTLEIKDKDKYWTVSVEGSSVKRLSADSILAIIILHGRYVLFHDYHRVTDSLWRVCRSEDWDGKGPAGSRVIWKGRVTHGISDNFGIMYFTDNMELWRISFDGTKERIPLRFPNIDLNYYRVRVSSDGKEIVYKTSDWVGRIGVIEDLFR
jgi:serine/threonine protein kinase